LTPIAAPLADPRRVVGHILGRRLAPQRRILPSEWADQNRMLSSKTSPKPGRWRTDVNPILREPMDCLGVTVPVREIVVMFPIQMGKSEIETNGLGYLMCEAPGPIIVALPGEVSQLKWINQKLNPLIEDTEAVSSVLASTDSRNASNQKAFKDFEGGQLYIEHAGSPARLKQTTARYVLVDELTEFANALRSGDDPLAMLAGRYSAFPGSYKRLDVSTPGIVGICRISTRYEDSDQRRYYVECPHCGEHQPLVWGGLKWSEDLKRAWYVCRENGCIIEEHHKPQMLRDIKAGGTARWVPEIPGHPRRGYTANCLYYQIGLGPRWADLAREWVEAQNDPAKLKTFVNDRLSEPWEDPAMRAVKHNVIQDRAEPYPLRVAPAGALVLTVGIDTQDDRVELQIVGWGRGMASWTIDYAVLPGKPSDEDVLLSVADLLARPILHESGALMRVEAGAWDIGGHHREAVKQFVRQGKLRRCMPIFGAIHNNAPAINKGKAEDIDWRGRTDRNGIVVYQVGTVAIKHMLFGRLSSDADKPAESRLVHFSSELPKEFFTGIVSETYNPSKNRFDKRRGARNEPLDTWVYAYAAARHPELRLHSFTRADWDAVEQRLINAAAQAKGPGAVLEAPAAQPAPVTPQPAASRPAAADRHSSLLDRLRSRR
jgi:phage terminase large subunit GpA-like protein